jgi:nicotinamidase-related amidase
MKRAVLVIDVQQGLCEGASAAYDAAGVIERINTVTAKARSAAVPVIFVQHESSDDYLNFGSPRWQLADGLVATESDLRIRKTTSDSFLRTDLAETLQSLGVKELVICGMHTEYCVDVSTRQALARGYPVILVEDGHAPEGNPTLTPAQIIAHHNVLLTNVWSFGPRARTVASDVLTFE